MPFFFTITSSAIDLLLRTVTVFWISPEIISRSPEKDLIDEFSPYKKFKISLPSFCSSKIPLTTCIEVLSKLLLNFSVQTPDERITKPVKVQITIVSINGSKIETKPSSTECLVLEVAWAIGADPWPASLEYKPLATP